MKKVFFKINEDVNITDPTIQQQYLAVKKQIADKQTKRDLQMKTVNQIDNEINILQQNLIALEAKDSSAKAKTQQTQTKQPNTQTNQQQNTNQQQTNTQNTNTQSESLKTFHDKKYINESESIYDDMVDNLQKEINKLADIKDYIQHYEEKTSSDITLNDTPLKKRLQIYNDNVSDEIEDIKRPFKTQEEKEIDETLKAEDKEQFVPNLVENEDVEAELDMLNYEDEDEPRDNYVFYIKIDADTDEEIIAKVYKDTADSDWVIRVVKGDEEPLQSMQLDERLDKLEVIEYLAEIFSDVEIMDRKEYEYLLDDKEKIDKEYFNDILDLEDEE